MRRLCIQPALDYNNLTRWCSLGQLKHLLQSLLWHFGDFIPDSMGNILSIFCQVLLCIQHNWCISCPRCVLFLVIPGLKSSHMRDFDSKGAVSKTSLHILPVSCLGDCLCVWVNVVCQRNQQHLCCAWVSWDFGVELGILLHFKMHFNGS